MLKIGPAGQSRTAVCCCLLVAWSASAAHGQAKFRGFWADAFRAGIKSTSQIDAMVGQAVSGRYNAIVAQVLPFHDNGASSHGAYWNSSILPKAPDIVGGIDPLAYLCTKAHENNIEVHAWLLPYRACTSWPPAGNTILQSNPQWISVPYPGGSGVAKTDDDFYMLDPGSPHVQDYLISIVRELVTNYPVDGIHWDYIRYTCSNAGYPSDNSYYYSGLKRFQRIYSYASVPAENTGWWNDFRRREIDELVRRCRAEIASIASNPRQPVRFSAAVFATGSAPTVFSSSAAYARFQNWQLWMQQGWLDTCCPMNYKEEHCGSEGAMYQSWVNAANNWKYNRHTFCGQANYKNTFANSVTQMNYALSSGAEGIVNYSYGVTRISQAVCDAVGVADSSWYPYVSSNLYTSTVATPTMPWRNPATATEGTVWGRVSNWETGEWVDNATVQVGSLGSVYTDGNGYYVVTLVPANAAGTSYNITATASGTSVTKQGAIIKAGDVVRYDLVFNAQDPFIAISSSAFSKMVEMGKQLPLDSFDVWNVYPGDMPFTVTSNASWLQVWPASGTSSGPTDKQSIGMAFPTQSLVPGAYQAVVTVAAPSSSNGTRTVTVNLQVVPVIVPGDFNSDGDVDLDDFATFQACLGNPGIPPASGCGAADLDEDGDVDQSDRLKFVGCISGEGILGNPDCAE